MSAAALNVLISQLRDLVEEYKAKRSQLENQTVRRPVEKAMDIDSDEEPDEEAADNKLQEAFLSLKKKIEIVKKSVPEGMPEDEDLRYVWAVAELERSVKESIKRRDVLQRVVGYQKQEIDVTQNYVQEKKAIYEEFQRKIKEFEAAPTQQDPNKEEDETKAELNSLAHKTRSTKIAYKEMRTFLGNLLPKLNESESSTLGPFLESLWRKSIDSDNGDDACLKLSHLDYDVDPADVALLVKFNVIEKVGTDADDDRFRLVQATH